MRNNILGVLLLVLILLGCRPQASEKLTIAVAANMQFAMKELTQTFFDESGIACETVVSSSGKLTAQITEGAPFDLFVSADMMYPTTLFNRGLTTKEPEIYAYGQLVLWTMKEGMAPSVGLLLREEINHIALANPKTAPYGVAAEEVMKYHGLYDQVKSKLVFGESISQANQFILSQAAEVGFTAKSVVLSPEIKGRGQWMELDHNEYTPIAQGVVILKNRETYKAESKKFYDFLFSDEGKEILNKFGYTVPGK